MRRRYKKLLWCRLECLVGTYSRTATNTVQFILHPYYYEREVLCLCVWVYVYVKTTTEPIALIFYINEHPRH